jgi:hypothetical protein
MFKFLQRAVPALCSTIVLWACGTDVRPRADSLPPFEQCRVPDAAEELQSAICVADPNGISQALQRAFSVSQPALVRGKPPSSDKDFEDFWRRMKEFRKQQYSILYRVFSGDRTVGTNMPWDAIMAPDFRTAVANRLANSVRDGSTAYGLKEFGDYALERLQTEAPDPRPATLELLGTADVPGLVAILRPYLFEARELRFSAAHGLALSCTDEATDLLLEAHSNQLFGDESSMRRLEGFLDLHRRVHGAWCANDETLSANPPER